MDFGLSMSFGDISVGGGWRETDTSDTTKGSVMDFGVGYSMGAMNVAVMYGQVNNEAPDGDGDEELDPLRRRRQLQPRPGRGHRCAARLRRVRRGAGPKDPTKDVDWVQFMIGTAISF